MGRGNYERRRKRDRRLNPYSHGRDHRTRSQRQGRIQEYDRPWQRDYETPDRSPDFSVSNYDFDESLYIDPKKGSKSNRLDLGARLVKLVTNNGGDISMAELENQLFDIHKWRFDQEDGLREFLDDFKDLFEIRNEDDTNEDGELGNEIVRCNLYVDICSTHAGEAGSCHNVCRSLHICKYFLLSDCDIRDCKFGHDLNTEHNKDVLKEQMLNCLDMSEIKQIVRNPSNRRGITIPAVCTYYNTEKGCRNKKTCPFLHICQYFVKGGCRFQTTCKRSHDIYDNQPVELLDKYGLKSCRQITLFNLINSESKNTQGLQPSCRERSGQIIPHRRVNIENDSFSRRSDDHLVPHFDTTKINSCGSDGIRNPVWKYTDIHENNWKRIDDSEKNKLEQKYQKYLEAKEHYLSISDGMYKLDFKTFEGDPCGPGSFPRVKLRRDMENTSSMFLQNSPKYAQR